MSTENNDMVALLKRQEQDRKDLAAGAFDAWQTLRETERKLLAPNNGHFDHAPKERQQAIIKGREDYFKEWGSEGRLAAVMTERHIREREAAVKRAQIIDGIRQSRERNKDKDREP